MKQLKKGVLGGIALGTSAVALTWLWLHIFTWIGG